MRPTLASFGQLTMCGNAIGMTRIDFRCDSVASGHYSAVYILTAQEARFKFIIARWNVANRCSRIRTYILMHSTPQLFKCYLQIPHCCQASPPGKIHLQVHFIGNVVKSSRQFAGHHGHLSLRPCGEKGKPAALQNAQQPL